QNLQTTERAAQTPQFVRTAPSLDAILKFRFSKSDAARILPRAARRAPRAVDDTSAAWQSSPTGLASRFRRMHLRQPLHPLRAAGFSQSPEISWQLPARVERAAFPQHSFHRILRMRRRSHHLGVPAFEHLRGALYYLRI